MFANLSDIVKIPVAIIIGMIISSVFFVLFYEGISLPLVGQVIDGRVSSAVKLAKSECDSRIEKTVSKFEYDALAAQLTKERQDRLSAEVASANAAIRAAEALRGKQAAEDEIDRLKAEADKDPDLTRPNAKDFQWTPKR